MSLLIAGSLFLAAFFLRNSGDGYQLLSGALFALGLYYAAAFIASAVERRKGRG